MCVFHTGDNIVYWLDRDDVQRDYLEGDQGDGCRCALNASCADPQYLCNCDIRDRDRR